MEWLQYDMLRVTTKILSAKLMRNKFVTFLSFILLMSAIFFIQLHPNSVWYYFAAGFFVCRMMELILEKTMLKCTIQNMFSRLDKLKKGAAQ